MKALKHEIPFRDLTIGELITDARTKRVFKGQLLGKNVAICISKQDLRTVSEKEADILTTIGKHPSIVRFIARSADNEGREVIVLEIAAHGNLHTIVSDEFEDAERPFSDRVMWSILDQIVDGMEELHRNGIIHKDLALRNILVFFFDKQHPERIRIKISDFGMSSIMDTSSSSYYYSAADSDGPLPIRWMAPEALSRNKWSEKSDVYSFGVLVWELATGGQVPWGLGRSNEAIQDKIMSRETLKCDEGTSEEVTSLIERCCSFSARDRPTFSEIKAIIASSRTSTVLNKVDQNERQEKLVRMLF